MGPEMTLDEAKAVVASKTAPRATEESIAAKVRTVDYLAHGHTTICIITMRSGFKFVGTSTPASPKNFDASVGERYAYDNAFRQIWTHEGYLLREILAATERELEDRTRHGAGRAPTASVIAAN